MHKDIPEVIYYSEEDEDEDDPGELEGAASNPQQPPLPVPVFRNDVSAWVQNIINQNEPGAGATSDSSSPTHADQDGPPPLVEVHEEDEHEEDEEPDPVVDKEADDSEMEEDMIDVTCSVRWR